MSVENWVGDGAAAERDAKTAQALAAEASLDSSLMQTADAIRPRPSNA